MLNYIKLLNKIMNSTIKSKRKSTILARVLSDQEISKNPYSLQKKALATSRSDVFEYNDKHRLIFTLPDPKTIHNINLQIPSLNSPVSLSTSNNQIASTINKKKSACIKGFSSKMNQKSPKVIKTRRNLKENDTNKAADSENLDLKVDNEKIENLNLEAVYLNEELQKALDENKILKKSLQDECIKDDSIDELMNSFKSRLYKLLYE